MNYLFNYLAAANLLAFILCGFDKRAARLHKRRISEATLLFAAALGGALGMFLGMQLFRHKTKHLKFTVLVPLFLLAHIALLYIVFKH